MPLYRTLVDIIIKEVRVIPKDGRFIFSYHIIKRDAISTSLGFEEVNERHLPISPFHLIREWLGHGGLSHSVSVILPLLVRIKSIDEINTICHRECDSGWVFIEPDTVPHPLNQRLDVDFRSRS